MIAFTFVLFAIVSFIVGYIIGSNHAIEMMYALMKKHFRREELLKMQELQRILEARHEDIQR